MIISHSCNGILIDNFCFNDTFRQFMLCVRANLMDIVVEKAE